MKSVLTSSMLEHSVFCYKTVASELHEKCSMSVRIEDIPVDVDFGESVLVNLLMFLC